MKALAIVIIALEILGSSWIGLGAFYQLRSHASVFGESTGSYTDIEGIEFASFADLEAYRHDKQLRHRYPLVYGLSSDELIVVGCLAFGMLGGATYLILRIAQGRAVLRLSRILAIPFLGLLSGFVVVLVFQFLPLEGLSTDRRNLTLLGTSLLAGVFFTPFYRSLGKLLVMKTSQNA
jgi:hypothetical protein